MAGQCGRLGIISLVDFTMFLGFGRMAFKSRNLGLELYTGVK